MAPSSSPSQFTPVNNNQPARAQHQDKANPVKWLIALGAVLAVIVLFAFLGTLGAPEMSSGVSDSATVTGPAGNNSSGESGVPQSADEMLKGF